MSNVWESLCITTHALALTECDHSWAGAGKYRICDSFNRIYWLESGEAQIEHNGLIHHIRRGNLHVIPAHATGTYECRQPMRLHWCHFNAQLLGGLELYDCAGFDCDVQIPANHWNAMDEKWRRLESLQNNSSPCARFEANAILFSFLSEMASTARQTEDWFSGGRYQRFAKVFEMIDSHLDRRLRVGDLASLVSLQENYFTNLFTANFGIAPMAYLKQKRLGKARLLLKSSMMPLKEIAEKCGFGSEYHLSSAFKKTMGIPPGAYRQSKTHEIP